MFQDRYEAANFEIWQGRVDSRENYDALRWHQWIKPLDLRQPLSKLFCSGGQCTAAFGTASGNSIAVSKTYSSHL